MAPLPPPTVGRPGFEPPTENFASAALPFDRRWCDSDMPPHCLEPSDRKLPPPPPPQAPPPQKSDIQFWGIEASESKNPLGDGLIGENNDFTRGWTSNICLGVCYANDPKKGGYTTPAPALDQTTSLRGDFTCRKCFGVLQKLENKEEELDVIFHKVSSKHLV